MVTFVQLLYLESLRLRTRDLPGAEVLQGDLEDKIGMKTEKGAGIFSLIKHTLLVLLGVLYLRAVVDGNAAGTRRFSGRPPSRRGSPW